MNDPRKLVARLNAASMKYEIGSGGLPELTPADISGALGMVPQDIGYEVFCALWWPSSARLRYGDLLSELSKVQFAEFSRLIDLLRAAQLSAHLADEDGLGSLFRAKRELDCVKALMWPGIGPNTRYKPIRIAVLGELSAPAICGGCAGRGSLRKDALVIMCPLCGGVGRKQVSDRRRAISIGVNESNYRRSWRLPYEYLFEFCRDAEQKTATALHQALGRSSQAA